MPFHKLTLPIPGTLSPSHTHTSHPHFPASHLSLSYVPECRYDDGIEGPARVWLKNQQIPGLAMSRSICDTVAKQAGCISTPEVFEVDLGADVRFIVLASDGLWEFMSNQEVRGAFLIIFLWSSLRVVGGGRGWGSVG
jgi:hypothetical protein